MDEIIVITGASSGIGKALTLSLIEKGKHVLAIARSIEPLLKLQSYNKNLIEIISADVATEEGRHKIFSSLSKNKKISALVHNAAVINPSGFLESIDLVAWRYQMSVNLEAPLFLTNKLLPFLQNSRILNLTVYASFHVAVGLGAYGISKAGLNMLTQYFNVELKKYNIALASVLPGIVETNIQKQLPGNDVPITGRFQKLKSEGKLISPEVAGKFLTWLLLDTDSTLFSSKMWDIYDDSHHQYWAKGLIIPTRS